MKKIRSIISLIGCIICGSVFAQPSIDWASPYGGSGAEYPSGIRSTSDGNYIAIGFTSSTDAEISNHGVYDVWVVKLNASGGLIWQRALGGSDMDTGSSITETSDGGYIIAAVTYSNDGNITENKGQNDGWIVKLSSDGIIQWQKTIGGSTSEWAGSVQQTEDGGYITAGSTDSNDGDVSGNHGSSDAWIVKLSPVGDIEWQKCLGGTLGDSMNKILQTADGGYIVGGSSQSNDGDVSGNHGSWDCWLIKLDAAGTLQWQRSLGGSGVDTVGDIQLTNAGGYIIAASTSSNDGDVSGSHGLNEFWLINLDASGNIIWQKCLGSSSHERPTGVQQTQDGGFVISGTTMGADGDVSGFHGNEDYWIVKLNNSGSILWQKTMGGSNQDQSFGLDKTLDGGYILAGTTYSTDGDITGLTGLVNDFWIVKLAVDPLGTEDFKDDTFRIYPNPNNGLFKLKIDALDNQGLRLKIYSSLGQLVHQSKITATETEIFLNNLPSGIYHLELDGNSRHHSQKLVIK